MICLLIYQKKESEEKSAIKLVQRMFRTKNYNHIDEYKKVRNSKCRLDHTNINNNLKILDLTGNNLDFIESTKNKKLLKKNINAFKLFKNTQLRSSIHHLTYVFDDNNKFLFYDCEGCS